MDHIGPNIIAAKEGIYVLNITCQFGVGSSGFVDMVATKKKKRESSSTQSWLPIQTTTWHSFHFFMPFNKIIAIEVIHYRNIIANSSPDERI